MKKRTTFSLLAIMLLCINSFAQRTAAVEIPQFDDKYSEYVKNLEAGQTDIDYQDFRFSFLESEQFGVASKRSAEFANLKKKMYARMNKSDYPAIIKITKQMLTIDYTSMIAHKILRQTYAIVGDTANATKYKTIQFGLLNSIVDNGDGKSCATAWPVIQLSEEYFILEMVGATLLTQSIDNEGGLCDKMQIKVDGKEKTYFFETSKIFHGYQKLLGE